MYAETAASYDAIYGFKDYAKEARELDRLLRSRTSGRRLLDVACGTGKHLEQFLALGWEVEGLDASESMLSAARDRLPGVEFHHSDMIDFDLGRQFDAITCLFSSIGYLQTLPRITLALRSMAKHLAAGGVLVVEPWFTPDAWHDGHLSSLFLDEPDLKLARVCRSETRGNLAVMPMEYLIATHEGVQRYSDLHEMGLFTVDEYLAAFQAAGLQVEHDPGGPTGRGMYIARSAV